MRLDRVRDVAEPVAGLALVDRRNSDSSVTRSSFAATGEISPTPNVRAPSATQPSFTTPMSIDRMSPLRSLNLPGIPCTTMWFGDAQIEPGKPR